MDLISKIKCFHRYFVLTSTCLLLSGYLGNYAAAEAELFNQLKDLDESSLLTELCEMIGDRSERLENISASCTHTVKNVEFDPSTSVTGKELLEGTKQKFELKRMGDSFLITSTPFPRIRIKDTVYPTCIECFDADKFIGKTHSYEPIEKPRYSSGTIRQFRSTIAQECFYFQVLGDRFANVINRHVGLWDFDGRFISKCDKKVDVEIKFNDPYVEVIFSAKLNAKESCTFTFDTSRDAMISSARVAYLDEVSQKEIQSRRYSVEKAEEIEGEWFPVVMILNAWSVKIPNQITIHRGTVERITLGENTLSDLEYQFPVGTDVYDEKTKTTHKVRLDGQ